MPKIVIADDEAHIRLLLEQTFEELEDHGVELFVTANGEEALDVITSEKPELVLLDIMMPRMSGYDVCKIIKNTPGMKDVYVILLTAKGQEIDRQQGKLAGADLYVTKPFDPDELCHKAIQVLKLDSVRTALPQRKLMYKSRLFIKIFSGLILQIFVFSCALYMVLSPVITSTVYHREEHSARALLESAYNLVNNIHSSLERERQDTLNEKKMHIQNIVVNAEAIIRVWQNEVKEGLVTEPEAKKRVLARLRMIQQLTQNYMWICDFDSRIIYHKDQHIEGSGFSRVKDAKGILFVPEIVEITREDGEAYHTYWWKHPGDIMPVERLNYSKLVPGWNWVLNGGVDFKDVDTEIEMKKRKAVQSLRTLFHKIRIGETGYLTVFDSNGLMLIHPSHELEGRNMGKLRDSLTGKPLLQELAESSTRPGRKLSYRWNKPGDTMHSVVDKIAWTRYFEGFDWYISATVYEDDLKSSSIELQKTIVLIALIFLLIAVIASYLFTRSIVEPIMKLSAMTAEVRSGNLGLISNITRNDELGELSKNFDSMVIQLKHRTDDLELANRDLMAVNEKLKELDTMKSSFLSTVSHELRTPLTSVLGFAKIIGNKLEKTIFPTLPEGDSKVEKARRQVQADLGIIVSEGQRLTHIINDVLDLAKMEAGKIEWKMEPVSVPEVVEKAAAATSSLFSEKNMELFCDLEESLPEVRGDRDRLIQVLINLLSNALKFTEQGKITIRAMNITEAEAGIPGMPDTAVPVHNTKGRCVMVSVSDTGIGIAQENHEEVFEQFKQIGDAITEKPRGTGLGLPICRQIIEHHCGRIWVQSEPGQGSTFSFILPAE